MQLATPIEPAMAVSTAINTFSICFQSMETHPIPPCKEGVANPPDFVFIFSITYCFLVYKNLLLRDARAPSLWGPTRSISVGSDGGSFSSPKEFCEAAPLGWGFPLRHRL